MNFICILEGITIVILAIVLERKRRSGKKLESQIIAQDRSFQCFTTMKKWMEAKLEGKSFDSYFATYDYTSVALYGAGEMGKLLYNDLKKGNIEVKYFVDRSADGIITVDGIPIVKLEDIKNQDKVDALIITPLGDYTEISNALFKEIPEMATVSIQEVVYEL